MTRYWEIAWDIFPQSGEVQVLPRPERVGPPSLGLKGFDPVDGMEIPPKVAELLNRPVDVSGYTLADKFPKTLHLIGSLGAGGAERQLVNLLGGLNDRGHHEQTLLTVYPLEGAGGHYAPYLREHEVKLRVNNQPIREEGVELIRNNFEIVQAIKAMPMSFNAWVMDLWVDIALERPTVVHCWLDHPAIWGGMAALLAGVPGVVLSGRNVHPLNFPYLATDYMRPYYTWMVKSPRVHLNNNSRPGAESYAEWIGMDVDDIKVVLNGVNLGHLQGASADERKTLREEIGVPQDAPAIVGAFRLSEEKRPELFVETFARAKKKHPNLHAVLMGEGPYEEAVKEAAKRLDVTDSFHLVGRRTDLPKVMTAMDVFVHTAFWEGTPNVVLEAQQLKIPVVVTDAGGSVHAVADGETGFLVKKEDINRLAEALIEVLDDLEIWKSKAKAGPAFIARQFGVDRMIDEMLELQHDAAESSRAQCPKAKKGGKTSGLKGLFSFN
jgi:glycosyltransferase involved in cell wall biosynthesis